MKIAGLHLWSVKMKNISTTLWITTRKYSMESALKKARRVIAKEYDPRAHIITDIENQGTLDA